MWCRAGVVRSYMTVTARSSISPARLYLGPTSSSIGRDADRGLHSLSASNDGETAYLALPAVEFAVVEESDFADGASDLQPHPLTINEERPTWLGPGAHSAVTLWAATGRMSPTRCMAPRPRPATPAHGVGRGSSTSRTRSVRRSRMSSGCRSTTRRPLTTGTRRALPTPLTTRR